MRTKDNPVQNVLPIEKTSIQERQVTVQVLTIGTRQVTQSLFNQLMSRSLVDEYTGELNGIIWGWVNLHKDCNYKSSDHFHTVWEKDGQLFKSNVHVPWAKPIEKRVVKRDGRYIDERSDNYYYQLLNERNDCDKDDGRRWNEYGAYDQAIEELESRWNQSFQAVKDAGQLFIAVSGVWG